jgi:TonB family protein
VRIAPGRGAVGVVAAIPLIFAAVAAHAQTEPEPTQPNGSSLPAGASGALVVAPKNEPAPPPKQAVLVPPKLTSDPGAAYPQQAITDGIDQPVTVAVVVDVDREGHVTNARVDTPAGHGFDDAAVEAAKGLVFEPATRDGSPIAARVKHAYVFSPPAARLVGRVVAATGLPIARASIIARGANGEEKTTLTDDAGRWAIQPIAPGTYHLTVAAPGFTPHESDETVRFGEEANSTDRLASTTPAPAAADQAEDVYVRGTPPPRDVTVRTLDQRELSRIPGTNGDALRGLLNLPGVARPPGLAGLLIVRGSAPQDTQVFVDGTLIPIVYHFGGLSSVIPTEMLDKIDFFPGNFSARYGRGFGGVVDVALAEPKSDKLHGLAQVDLIDARVMAQGPLYDTGWNFAVAGRRSWVDVWLKPVLESTGAGVTAAPVYYDYQGMLEKTWDKGKQDFRVALFGSDDRLAIILKSVSAEQPELTGGISSHTGFWRAQVRYRNKISDSTELRVTAATGQDFVSLSIGSIFFDVTEDPLSSRIELAQKIAKDATNDFGLDLLYEPYNVNAQLPVMSPPGQPPPGPILSKPPVATQATGVINRPGFYDDLELTPWKGGRLVPGARLDYSNDTQDWDFAPRFLARQDLTSGFPRTTLKAAVGVYFEPPQPQDTNRVFGQTGLRSERATEYDVGLEQELTSHVDVAFDAYYKQEDDLIVADAGNQGTGHALGLETLLRWRPDSRFFGWLAYTLSRSVVRDGPGQPEHLSPYDQTHILTVLGSYRLGRGWELGGRFRLVSGDPYTPNAYGFYDANNGSYLPLTGYPPDSRRLPIFHQLDIRVDKTWRFPKWQLSAYLDVQNVYNQGNVEGTSANYNYTQQSYATGLPILPSLGIRAEF